MVTPLQTLLEREFRLCYHIPGFSIRDLRDISTREVNWFHSRLVQELRDEEETRTNMR